MTEEDISCIFDFNKTGRCFFPNEFEIESGTGKVIFKNYTQKNCTMADCPNKKTWRGHFLTKSLIKQDISFIDWLISVLDKAYSEESQAGKTSKEEFDVTLDFIFLEANRIRIFFDDSKMPTSYVAPGAPVPTINEQLRNWQRGLKNYPIEITINDSDRLILWNETKAKTF